MLHGLETERVNGGAIMNNDDLHQDYALFCNRVNLLTRPETVTREVD